jgi:cell wall-associated NlpC family hydrolase
VRLSRIAVVVVAAGLTAVTAPPALASNSGGAAYNAAAPAPAIIWTSPVTPVPAGVAPAAPAAPTAVAPGTAPPPADTGGQAYGTIGPVIPQVIVPGAVAKILPSGYAAAPAAAPAAIQQAIFAANQIVGLPYVWGGGHQAFIASGYDCSGTVSYALHGGSLLAAPMDSSDFMRWGVSGHGQWVTIFSNPSHVYMTIAGIRLDTSTAGDPSRLPGPRWRPVLRSNRGFKVRTIAGY